MDIEETLRVLRELSKLILEGDEDSCDVIAIAEHFEALDNWLNNKGALPADWRK